MQKLHITLQKHAFCKKEEKTKQNKFFELGMC